MLKKFLTMLGRGAAFVVFYVVGGAIYFGLVLTAFALCYHGHWIIGGVLAFICLMLIGDGDKKLAQ